MYMVLHIFINQETVSLHLLYLIIDRKKVGFRLGAYPLHEKCKSCCFVSERYCVGQTETTGRVFMTEDRSISLALNAIMNVLLRTQL
uniref:Uncharacterized protein n=1 Tax=Bartonella ancashensis TaxID=1318743 RepID=A0A1V0PNF9_9HYPH|nr:hypothetical protein [Bartonella ancashensis]